MFYILLDRFGFEAIVLRQANKIKYSMNIDKSSYIKGNYMI